MTHGYIDFDASNDYCRVDAYDGRRNEGITLDTRLTTGGHRWSDDEWQGRVDLHLRQADNIAQILGTYVRYEQLWCEQRAKTIGAWHPMPDSMTGRPMTEENHMNRDTGETGPAWTLGPDLLRDHLTKHCAEDCPYCAKRRSIEARERQTALEAVAHRAWHLLDDGGEVPDDPGTIHASKRDADLLSDALDALEATGWDAHPVDDIGSQGGSDA